MSCLKIVAMEQERWRNLSAQASNPNLEEALQQRGIDFATFLAKHEIYVWHSDEVELLSESISHTLHQHLFLKSESPVGTKHHFIKAFESFEEDIRASFEDENYNLFVVHLKRFLDSKVANDFLRNTQEWAKTKMDIKLTNGELARFKELYGEHPHTSYELVLAKLNKLLELVGCLKLNPAGKALQKQLQLKMTELPASGSSSRGSSTTQTPIDPLSPPLPCSPHTLFSVAEDSSQKLQKTLSDVQGYKGVSEYRTGSMPTMKTVPSSQLLAAFDTSRFVPLSDKLRGSTSVLGRDSWNKEFGMIQGEPELPKNIEGCFEEISEWAKMFQMNPMLVLVPQRPFIPFMNQVRKATQTSIKAIGEHTKADQKANKLGTECIKHEEAQWVIVFKQGLLGSAGLNLEEQKDLLRQLNQTIHSDSPKFQVTTPHQALYTTAIMQAAALANGETPPKSALRTSTVLKNGMTPCVSWSNPPDSEPDYGLASISNAPIYGVEKEVAAELLFLGVCIPVPLPTKP